MPISVTCQCGESLSAPDSYAGLKATCKACGAAVAIPAWVASPSPSLPRIPPVELPDPTSPVTAPRAAGISGNLGLVASIWRGLAAFGWLASALCLFAALVASQGNVETNGVAGWPAAAPWLAYAFEAAVFGLASWTAHLILTNLPERGDL